MKKWIFIIIGVLIVGLAGYYFFVSKSSSSNQQALMQNRTATVQKGQFQVKVSGTGTVQPVTSEDIKSMVSNNEIAEVLVTAGETVKKGESLITFTDGSDPITAPADGTITTISVSSGEKVNIGQAVAHLTNYSNLKTAASIDELDIPNVKVGQTATITVSAYPDQTFTGKVLGIANEGTSTNGVTTFNVDVSIDNPKNLKVGMSTESSILTASKDNALYVPLEAVHTVNGEKYVFLADSSSNSSQSQSQGQSSNRVTVQTGLANDDYVEITKGLTEGQVVSLPNLTVSSSSSTTGSSKGSFGGMQGAGGMAGGAGSGGFGGGNAGRSGN